MMFCRFRNLIRSQCRADWLPPAAGAAIVVLMVGGLLSVGCESTPRAQRNSSANLTHADDDGPRTIRHQQIEEIEQRYVIGPIAAREIGYRIDWQFPDAGENMKILSVQDDAVLALDGRNFLTRINRDGGARLWRLPIAEPILEIFGVTLIEPRDRVYVTTGGAVLELDATNGSQVGRQRLEKIANTAPAVHGPHLVYGGRNGQLIWHSYAVAYQWRAYQVSRSIRIAPVVANNVAITIGVDGRVIALNVREARMLWSKRLLGRVEARPAVGAGGVFIAGTDQHVWAFDLYSGRTLWRYLSESALTQPPTFHDNRVYQSIPDQGLVCFDAFPLDRPGGAIVWENPDVRGNVVGVRQNRALVWHQPSRTLTIVDAQRGGTIQSIQLPDVHRLVLPNIEAEEMYAAAADGRIVRLIPRN